MTPGENPAAREIFTIRLAVDYSARNRFINCLATPVRITKI